MRQTMPLASRVVSSGAKLGQFGRRAIGGKDQLPALAQQRVDRVQQFDLGGPLAGEELQVVEDQQLDAAILAAEVGQAAAAQGLEKLAGELLGREIDGRWPRRALRAAVQIPSSKCVLPTPVGPWISSGVICRAAGDHSAETNASRLLCPMTNDDRGRRIFAGWRAADFRGRGLAVGRTGRPRHGLLGRRFAGLGADGNGDWGDDGGWVGCDCNGGGDPGRSASSTLNFDVGQLPSVSRQAFQSGGGSSSGSSRGKSGSERRWSGRWSKRNHVPVPNQRSNRSFPTLSASSVRTDTISISSLVTSLIPARALSAATRPS